MIKGWAVYRAEREGAVRALFVVARVQFFVSHAFKPGSNVPLKYFRSLKKGHIEERRDKSVAMALLATHRVQHFKEHGWCILDPAEPALLQAVQRCLSSFDPEQCGSLPPALFTPPTAPEFRSMLNVPMHVKDQDLPGWTRFPSHELSTSIREVLLECRNVADKAAIAIGNSLGIRRSSIDQLIGDHELSMLRVSEYKSKDSGVNPHCDTSLFTLLLPCGSTTTLELLEPRQASLDPSGLGNSWRAIDPSDCQIVLLAGEMLEHVTNGTNPADSSEKIL